MSTPEIKLNNNPYYSDIEYFDDKDSYIINDIHIYTLSNNYIKDIAVLRSNILKLTGLNVLHLNIDPSSIYRRDYDLYISEEKSGMKTIKEEIVYYDDLRDYFAYSNTFTLGMLEENLQFYNIIFPPKLEEMKASIRDRISSLEDRDSFFTNINSKVEKLKEEVDTYKNKKEEYMKMEEKDLLVLLKKEIEETEDLNLITFVEEENNHN